MMSQMQDSPQFNDGDSGGAATEDFNSTEETFCLQRTSITAMVADHSIHSHLMNRIQTPGDFFLAVKTL